MGELPQSRIVLAIGRWCGRRYRRGVWLRERWRIRRAGIPERVEPARNLFALTTQPRRLLLALLALIVAGLVFDEVLRLGWSHIAGHGGADRWLRGHLSKPSLETLRTLLAAAAAGTATILGLIVSISLITWQTTADRYRSSSIVAFLLRERLSAAVVRLLALSFAYSLWVLALLEVFSFHPYGSAALALILSTLAVLSLIGYRQLGLLGYLPARIATSLREEITGELKRAQGSHASAAVEDYSRRVVEADLQIFRDLLTRLRQDDEALDVAACLHELGVALASFLASKQRFEPDSFFFVRRRERLGPAGYALDESILAQGLTERPTTAVPDHLWLERRLLDVVDLATPTTLLARREVTAALVFVWATALQYAWHQEDADAVDTILTRLEAAAAHPEFRADPDTARALLSVAWILVELATNGFSVSSQAIVGLQPWRAKAELSRLPWKAQDDARALAKQIQTELFVTGNVVSPRWAMVAELDRRREPRIERLRSDLTARALALCQAQLKAAIDEDAAGTLAIAEMTTQTLLRAGASELSLPDLTALAGELKRFLAHASDEQLADLQEATGRAARVLAEQQRWQASYSALEVSQLAGLHRVARASDPQTSLGPFFDNLFTAAIVYAWAEFHQERGHVREIGQYVQPPYTNLDGLAEALANHQLGGLYFPTVVHFQWAQPLTQRAAALSEIPVFDGGLGYSTRKDHPSSLFARASLLGAGPSEFLEHLIQAVLADRAHAREELLSLLAAQIEKRKHDDHQ